MDILIYGPDRPKLGLEQAPDGKTSIRVSNEYTYQTDRLPPTVTFADLYDGYLPSLGKHSHLDVEEVREREERKFREFMDELLGLVGSKAEEKFFRLYIQYLQEIGDYDDGMYDLVDFQTGYHPWTHPALIPQVWVNWRHYDSEDSERAELAKEEPFRVDFVVKDAGSELGEGFTVIEVDGASHFGYYELDPVGNPVLESSMAAYTEHLKKDRWLRRKGWDVVRVSSQEVEQLDDEMDFQQFYNEILMRMTRYFLPDDDLPF